jgi:hypothetical protein
MVHAPEYLYENGKSEHLRKPGSTIQIPNTSISTGRTCALKSPKQLFAIQVHEGNMEP